MNFFLYAYLLLMIFIPDQAYALAEVRPPGIFTGRISRLNKKASLIRIRSRFKNIKYLQVKDKVELWSEGKKFQRCLAFIEGRTSEYILLKVPHLFDCTKKVDLTVGAYLTFLSNDFINNLEKGKNVLELLSKKRIALQIKVNKAQKELDAYIDRVDAINTRYEVLLKKMEQEWQTELSDLEADKIELFRKLKDYELRLDQTDQKLEQYHIQDDNLERDRWALDPRLYHKK